MAFNIQQAADSVLGRGALNSPQTFFSPVAMGAGEDTTSFYNVMDRILSEEKAAQDYRSGIIQSQADTIEAERQLETARLENELVPALQELEATDPDFQSKLAQFEPFAPHSKTINNIMNKKVKDNAQFVSRMGTAAGLASMSGMDNTGVQTTLNTLTDFLRAKDVVSTSALMGRLALSAQTKTLERETLPQKEAATKAYERRKEAADVAHERAVERDIYTARAASGRESQRQALELMNDQRDQLIKFNEEEADIRKRISPELLDDPVFGWILNTPFLTDPKVDEKGNVIIEDIRIPDDKKTTSADLEASMGRGGVEGEKTASLLKDLVRRVIDKTLESGYNMDDFEALKGTDGKNFKDELIKGVYAAASEEGLYSRFIKTLVAENSGLSTDSKKKLDEVKPGDDFFLRLGELAQTDSEIRAADSAAKNFLSNIFGEVQAVKELLTVKDTKRRHPLFQKELIRYNLDRLKKEEEKKASEAGGGKDKKDSAEEEAERLRRKTTSILDNPETELYV